MIRIIYLLCIFQLVIFSCKEKSVIEPESKVAVTQVPMLSEIITKGFAVTLKDGEFVQDSLQQMQAISFDAKGREQSNVFYDLDGTQKWRDVYLYNEDDFKIGSKYYEAGQNKITYKYEIDSLGRRLKYVAYDAQSAAALYDGYSRYENDGKLRKDGFKDSSGMIRWEYEYLFDENQNELGYVYINTRNGQRFKSIYKIMESDSINRWIKRGIYQNDTLRGIEERIFKYQ